MKPWITKKAQWVLRQKESRIIISKENSSITESGILKANYLNNLNTKNQIILVDDDNKVLKIVKENVKNIILFQDSELID